MEEETLVQRLQQGDRAAFDALYEKYHIELLRTASLITGSRTDGEDVTQEAFVQCYQMIRQLRDASRFRPWLFRLMTRAAWKQCRKRGQEQPVETIFETGTGEDSALQTVLHTEQNRQLYQAVHQLEEKQRTVVILYYFNDMSVHEIARIISCREGTVKSRLHTARHNLQKALTSEILEEV